MKKLLALVLVVAIFLCGAFFIYTLAESADPAPRAAPLVDLTGAFVAVVLVVFDFLLAWIARVMIPPIKEWLKIHTTEKQRNLIWDAICKLVDAAEQTIKGPGQGAKRLAYVEAALIERGFSIDDDLIEAAVKRMKDRTGLVIGEAFGAAEDDAVKDVAPIPLDDKGEPDLEITHWNVAQLKTFCELNDIPSFGCVTKEDYIAAIEHGTIMSASEAHQQKDYCDLDDDGNPIPEQPQSAVE